MGVVGIIGSGDVEGDGEDANWSRCSSMAITSLSESSIRKTLFKLANRAKPSKVPFAMRERLKIDEERAETESDLCE